jgi:phosphatidylserine/phosphatidylglycerophosphate/cardiolipin synthase-like enzyme
VWVINYEFLAVIHSRELARTLNEIIEYEIAQSRRITIQDCERRRWWQKLIDRLAWSLHW